MDLNKIIEEGLKIGAEFVELRYGSYKSLIIRYIDGNLKDSSINSDEGIGIRVFYKGAWGFSSTSKIDLNSLMECLNKAYKVAKLNSQYIKNGYKLNINKAFKANSIIEQKIKFENVDYEEKLNMVKHADSILREDNRIKSTSITYIENQDKINVLNSLGTNVYKEEYYSYLSLNAYSLEGTNRGVGSIRIGGTGGYEVVKEKNIEEISKKAYKRAIEQLKSKNIKPGQYICIIDPLLGGVFAHEGIGHPAEADSICEKNSVLENKLGKEIASKNVTIIDYPLIKGAYGYYEYDDEGFPAKKKYIIKEGILNEFLHNIETSIKLNMENNGSARADSYLNEPLVRMSNIYFEKGDMSFEELIEDIQYGIYAIGFNYGYVTPNTGQYTFKCEHGYIIEKGEIKDPIKDVSLTGLILETLKEIDGIGKDLIIEGIGYCGKDGQYVRVGDGSPHLRVRKITVGGIE